MPRRLCVLACAALLAALIAVPTVATAQLAGTANDLASSAETLSVLSERFGVPVVAWLGAGDSVPESAREAEDLRSAVGEIMRTSPGAWELRDDVLVLSLPPTWHRGEGVRRPSDLVAMRATLEWIPSESMVRLARGETVDTADLPVETTDALRVLVETAYRNDEMGRHYLRAIEAGRIGLRFLPLLTLLAVTADILPSEWIACLDTHGEEARQEVDWSRWSGWAAVSEPEQPTEALPAEPVHIESGVYSLDELTLAVSEATDTTFEAGGDCADRQVYVAVERMSAARLVGLIAEACCLSIWQDRGTVLVGNAVPYDDMRRLKQRNLSFFIELLEPLTEVPPDSQAARVAAQLMASPTTRLVDLPEDLQAFVRQQCPKPLGADAEVRLIPGFSLCLYPPEGGRYGLLFY